VFFNFTRIHKTPKATPAMAVGISDRLWSMEDIANLIEVRQPAQVKRGPDKKRNEA